MFQVCRNFDTRTEPRLLLTDNVNTEILTNKIYKMTPTEFLRNRNIVAEDKSDLIIGFSNGTEESLIELLDSYHQEKLKLLDLHGVVKEKRSETTFCPTCNDQITNGECYNPKCPENKLPW